MSHTALESGHPTKSMTAGGAVGDFNNDGWPDLFVIDGGGAPDRLFINNGDGTFTDEAASWGLTDTHYGSGAAVGDFNNDGHLDIYVTSFGLAGTGYNTGQHRLYRNSGAGSFTEVAFSAGVHESTSVTPDGFGAAFGDYDLDGDLDLFVCGWHEFSDGNRLFQNNGNETFSDVTVSAGVFDPDMHGFSPRFADMDGDCHPELLIAADYGTSHYYLNNADGTFTDITPASGTGLDTNGMGQCVGDFNRDGRLDWYVTSIFHDTMPNGLFTGNKLYYATADHLFDDVSVAMAVEDGGWGWGAEAVDVNNDGHVDIVETNGWDDQSDQWENERAKVFYNNAGTPYLDVALPCQLAHDLLGRGLVRLDYDKDGDQDIVIFSYSGELQLWRNDDGSTLGNSLTIHCDTSLNPALAPNGFGTRVEVTTVDGTQVVFIDGGGTYVSTSEISAHFGLGSAATVTELRVKWSDGSQSRRIGVGVNQTITLINAGPTDLNADGAINSNDLAQLLGFWGSGDPVADVDGDGTVTSADLAQLIGSWNP